MTAAGRIELGGCPIDLCNLDEAIEIVSRRSTTAGGVPLGVVSVNLDHVHHFGTGSRWHGSLDRSDVEWIDLIDGAPLAAQAHRATGTAWPRLAGSDLIGPILHNAERDGASVGFLGGDAATQEKLRAQLSADYPELRISGFWSPPREDIGRRDRSMVIAGDIAEAKTDILVVGLGKPRQELWIAQYAGESGAHVLLAFGAVVDFLAGRIERAPQWVAQAGMEWAWRLSREPRRLATRYLVDGPPAYLAIRRKGRPGPKPAPELPAQATPPSVGRFLAEGEAADIAVVVVTFNNADDVDGLIASLRVETANLRLRVIVADNGSTDATLVALARQPDVLLVETGGNLGYAGGINAALTRAGDARSVLILNPDLVAQEGALQAMFDRMIASSAGAVVPQMLDAGGAIYPSLRREPTVGRAIGDALLGGRFGGRPGWTSELDSNPESYLYPHRIDWATGAAILINRQVADEVGRWDARFFLYSEETDFFRRVRELGYGIWFEPLARVSHAQGGSGSSNALASLMSVNRVRYARKHHSAGYAAATHLAALLHETMRSYDPAHRATLRMLLDQRSWQRLPKAVLRPPTRAGSIVIPAHNEEAVIARTLGSLATLAESGTVEIVVVCNGCTDGTAAIASGFPGVLVREIDTASKTAALNVGDASVRTWPRLYLDADVEVTPGSVAAVFSALDGNIAAARPEFRYDTTGASAAVRAYYRARERMPSTRSALWGAGAYAVSENGHSRFGMFPDATADDLFVDRQFAADEIEIVDCEPVRVHTPRTTNSLIAVLTRQRRGNRELGAATTSQSTVGELLRSIRGPLTLFDAVIYAALTTWGRRASAAAVGEENQWERDDSSRITE
jgi:exopolysaccharide biosynthesis WecB/TagA/CpsF family protein